MSGVGFDRTVDVVWVFEFDLVLGDFGGNFFPVFMVASISSHGDTVGGVVLVDEIVVGDKGENGFGVLNGETRDAGEVAEISVRLRMSNRGKQAGSEGK